MSAGSPGASDPVPAYGRAVEQALAEITTSIAGDDPVSAAARYALSGGGKRLRPVLCLAAADACGGSTQESPEFARAACAIELIHTYSLVHDDLPCMDDDDLRRGRPTTHRAFGTRAAMYAGFALVPLASGLLDDAAARLGLSAPERTALLTDLCHAAGAAGMVAGQLLDLDAERQALDVAALRRIHALKTGALFQGALRIGGRLARTDAARLDALAAFGARLGMAFQITDDVLDTTRDAAVLGKTPGKDSAAGKATFVLLLGVDGARRAAAEEADAAVHELAAAGIRSPVLESMAEFAVRRDR